MSSSTNTLKDDDGEEVGIRARFKKRFFQKREKSVDRRPGGEGDRSKSSSSKSAALKSADTTSKMKTGVVASKSSPREVAEVEFRTAAINLNNAMAKSSCLYQLPEAITLQTVDHVDDVETTCHNLEIAIDKIIDKQAFITEGGRQAWKECIKSWY